MGLINKVSAREGKCCQVSKNTTTLSGNDDVELEKWNREKRERVCVYVCTGGRLRGDNRDVVAAAIAE